MTSVRPMACLDQCPTAVVVRSPEECLDRDLCRGLRNTIGGRSKGASVSFEHMFDGAAFGCFGGLAPFSFGVSG